MTNEKWNDNFSILDIQIAIDTITLPENVVYFKILDFFAVHSEKMH